MYALLVLVGLALGLSVVLQTLDEILPVRANAALMRATAVAVGTAMAWMLDYSAFTAFGQELRAEWMHPLMTGLLLVAVGEFVRSLVHALAHRAGDRLTEQAPASRAVRAA